MGDAKRGVKLFTTTNEREASEIANDLNLENASRKSMEQEILAEALEKIESSAALKQSRIIVVSGNAWHHGVIGIVSSRIKDLYYRSNIVLSVEDGVATGSARAADGLNMFEALESCKDLLIKFDGQGCGRIKPERRKHLTTVRAVEFLCDGASDRGDART